MRDGLSWVNLQGASMERGWKAGGPLCCLLGLSPCWAVIKSRPWCEVFCWGSSRLLPPQSLDASPKEDVICFLNSLSLKFPHTAQFSCLPWAKYITRGCPHTCSESQVMLLLDLKGLADILHIAPGQELKVSVKVTRITKIPGVEALQLIFSCCTHTRLYEEIFLEIEDGLK